MSSCFKVRLAFHVHIPVQIAAKEGQVRNVDGAASTGGVDNSDDALREPNRGGDDVEDVDAELRSLNAEARDSRPAQHSCESLNWLASA
jgi:hypothetical protein